MSIEKNINFIRERIETACRRVSRSSSEVDLIAVTKTVDARKIEEAIAAGIKAIGENRVQEAWRKFREVKTTVHWHFIGHLQTNKVKRALQFFDTIQSVDSLRLAQEIDRQSERLERTTEILIQVNTSGEETKFGMHPQEALPVIREIAKLPHLHIKGLMTIGAHSPDEEEIRRSFRRLRQLRNEISAENVPNVSMTSLSMGMTNDFEIAIEEGATAIRLGRSIFGERTT